MENFLNCPLPPSIAGVTRNFQSIMACYMNNFVLNFDSECECPLPLQKDYTIMFYSTMSKLKFVKYRVKM